MKREKSATDWRNWKITDEQAEAIFNGSIPDRNRFYTDNFVRLRKMAWGYIHRNPAFFGMLNDLLQGVYIDMDFFYGAYNKPVRDGRTLSHFVYWSFSKCKDGGLIYLAENNRKLLSWYNSYTPPARMYSLDAPAALVFGRSSEEVEGTLGDVLPSPFRLEDEVLLRLSTISAKLFNAVCSKLSPRLIEFLNLYIEGYTPSEAAREMGVGGQQGRKYLSQIRACLAPYTSAA